MNAPGLPPAPGTAAGTGSLDRSLGLTLLVLYGLGVTVGAGIYVLVGTAAGRAGVHAPLAFIIAGAVMALSAASFAELAARFPVSAGEAAYVERGLGSERLALVTGLMVIAAGTISAAAIAQGAAGYLGQLLPGPPTLLVAVVVVSMGAVAAWGIKEAVGLAAVMTVIEIGGLLAIIGFGLWREPTMLADLPLAFRGLGEPGVMAGVLGASLVAFFAFIGFEGMVNVAEEVRKPERTLPLAIAITLAITIVLYILTVWVVIRAVPAADLSGAKAPLSLAYERITGASPLIISLIAVFATINGVIVQMVMSSRVVYGLARQGQLPHALATVNPMTRTPLRATLLIVAATLILATAFPIDRLADWTTRVMLVVFVLVNVALMALKRASEGPQPAFSVPAWVPAFGAASATALLIGDLLR